MPMRILLATSASSGRFPRWGYLDKFTANEYLARAFGVTIAIVALLEIGVHVWPDRPQLPLVPVPAPSIPLPHQVMIDPPPSNCTKSHPSVLPHPSLVKQFPKPIPVPVPVDVVDLFVTGSGSGAGTGTEGDAPAADGDWGGVTEVSDAPVWPSPDQLIVVEHEPELVSMQTPPYPEIARLAHIEGTVLVRVLVDTEGFVRDTRILQSVLGLDEAAVTAASTAVFRPARQQDRPVAVWVVVPVEFRLYD
jgi:periplasmic protein TonB